MLKGKTILIAGGGSGIGEALATNLSNDNKIIIFGRNGDKLAKAATDNMFNNISDEGSILDVLFNTQV